MADREAATLALARYLERQLGITVNVVRTASYGPATEAISRGEIDVMSLGPFAYALAAESGAAEAIVATGRSNTGPRTYRSVLIANRGSGLAQVADLRTRAGKIRFNYTDPASNSGHLVPQARLAAAGVVAERDFASTEFTLSHNVAIFNVAFGRADLAGVSDTALQRLLAKKRVHAEDLVVLWTSEALPLGPIAVRRALPDELKHELQRALVELHQRDPAAAAAVMAQYPERDVTFLACDDSLYDPVRRLAASVEKPKN